MLKAKLNESRNWKLGNGGNSKNPEILRIEKAKPSK